MLLLASTSSVSILRRVYVMINKTASTFMSALFSLETRKWLVESRFHTAPASHSIIIRSKAPKKKTIYMDYLYNVYYTSFKETKKKKRQTNTT